MSRRKVNRREFMAGAAAAAAIAAAAACKPSATPAPAPTAAQGATSAPAAVGASAGATSAPTVHVPTILYSDKACVHRYLTGGYTQGGPEDHLIKELQEEALRKEYGINVDIQFESASWADIDSLMEIRLQTQGCDSLQRSHGSVMRWLATPGLIRDIDAVVREYGQNLLNSFPESAWQFFMRDDGLITTIPSLRSTPCDIEYLVIRRDWLDQVDRDIPTTVEELEECLRLFKQRGLGGNVTIPFTNENPSWMQGACLNGPWVPEPEEQMALLAEGADVGLAGNFDEERLEMLQRWYKDGLLNNEWTSWKYDQVYDACARGMVGCVSGGWWVLNQEIREQVLPADPTQDWVHIFPPVGRKDVPNTGRVRAGGPMERGLVVTSWAPCPEAIVALADWDNKSFDNFLISRNGVPDKHWKWGSGGWVENLKSPPPNPEYSGMRGTTWTQEWNAKRELLPPQPGQEPIDPNVTPRIYSVNIHTRKVAHVPEQGEYPVLGTVDRWCAYMYPESQATNGDRSTLASEYFAKIVNGELPVSAGRKEFFERWTAAGGDVNMRERMDQYNKFMEEHPEWKDPRATFAPDTWNTESNYPDRPKQS